MVATKIYTYKDDFFVTAFNANHVTDNYLSWWDDQETTRYTSHGLFPKSKKDIDSFLDSVGTDKLVWAIYNILSIEDDQQHIGNISLQEINFVNRSAELALILDKRYWSKGFGTKAGSLMLYHGFEKLNLHRVWLGIVEKNIGMMMLAEKLGFQKEGVSRQSIYIEGKYEDITHYGLLRSEWDKIKNNLWEGKYEDITHYGLLRSEWDKIKNNLWEGKYE